LLLQGCHVAPCRGKLKYTTPGDVKQASFMRHVWLKRLLSLSSMALQIHGIRWHGDSEAWGLAGGSVAGNEAQEARAAHEPHEAREALVARVAQSGHEAQLIWHRVASRGTVDSGFPYENNMLEAQWERRPDQRPKWIGSWTWRPLRWRNSRILNSSNATASAGLAGSAM